MAQFRICLCMLATLLSLLATSSSCYGAEIFLRAGPWMLLQDDGSVRIGMELAGVTQIQDLAPVHLLRGKNVLALAPVVSGPLRRGLQGESYYLSFELPADEVHGSLELLSVNGEGADDWGISLTLPQKPAADSNAVVVFASALNYPLRGDLERIARELGQAVQLVVLLGDNNQQRIGMGGWESEVPIVSISDLSTPQNKLQQAVFGDRVQWRHGLHWGVLAMPSAPRDEEILTALNSGPYQWQIFLDPQIKWDLSASSIKEKTISSLRYMLAICSNKQLPIILAAGSGSSFISEPLAVKTSEFGITAMNLGFITVQQWKHSTELMKHGQLLMRTVLLQQEYVTQSEAEIVDYKLSKQRSTQEIYSKTGGVVQWPGGIRYCSISAAGLPFRHITDEVALPIYAPSLCVVYADADRCRIMMSRESAPPLELNYYKKDPQQLSSWGEQDVATLYQDIIGKDMQKSSAAITSMLWVPGEKIRSQITLTSYELRELLSTCLADENGELLLRRLSIMDKTVVLSWLQENAQASMHMQRDVVLRILEKYEYSTNSDFENVIMTQDDFHIMWPLLKKYEQLTVLKKIGMSTLLERRLRLQLAGRLGFNQDPMLQRELMSHIFESPYMSPTPLRPLARAVREKLHPLAVGPQSPVQRFFDLYGEKRRD